MKVKLARPRTLAWLDQDVEVIGDVPHTATLNGPGGIDLILPLRYANKTGEDGKPLLLEWGTTVILEDEHHIVGGRTKIVAYGLIDKVTPGPRSVKISAAGLSVQANDTPWRGPDREWINQDALGAWRHIWTYIRHLTGKIPVSIDGDTTCGVDVGRGESQKHRDVRVRIEAAQRLLARYEKDEAEAERLMIAAARSLYSVANKKKIGKISSATRAPSGEGDADECTLHIDNTARGNVVQAYFWVRVAPGTMGWGTFSETQARSRGNRYRDLEKTRDAARVKAREQQEIIRPLEQYVREKLPESHAEPYMLTWYQSRDLAANLAELAELGGFDWYETARWEGDVVRPALVARKRAGVRREQIVFEVGTNVHEEPSRDAKPYYSDLHVFGAGEGSDTLHADEVKDDGVRVRRTKHVVDKDAKTKQLVDSAATKERKTLGAGGVEVTELVVLDRKAAPFGSFGLGDEVLLRAKFVDGGRLSTWVRVVEITTQKRGRQMKVKVEAP